MSDLLDWRPATPPGGDSRPPQDILRDVFGFSSFRPGQSEIVEAVCEGAETLAIMPTGGGKSLCYQLPALMRPGVTIVVSPLIALMRDQVSALRALGVAAAAINSGNEYGENGRAFQAAADGRLKLLYISPERLLMPDTIERLSAAPVAMLAVDEAHCVSQWGHDFRPEYRQLLDVRRDLKIPQTVAFTATADSQTRADIAQRLFEGEPRVFVRSFDRPNIHLAMSPRNNGREQLLRFLAQHEGQSGVVYCQSRKRVDETAAFLAGKGFKALPYHAGLEREERDRNQDIFLRDDGVIVVATVAFGMGVDKPDVRFVFHMDLPKNIESYYQEIGRAGRDGLPASAHALYGFGEIRQFRQWIEASEASDAQKRIERQKVDALVGLCEAHGCRRQVLLQYFGEPSEPCGNCDQCGGAVETFDGTVLAQKALSAVVRTDERFGVEHLINVLRGEATDKVVQHGHDSIKTFGVGKDQSRKTWRSIFRQLGTRGHAGPDAERHNGWRISDSGWKVLRGQETVAFKTEVLDFKDKAPRAAADAPEDYDKALFARLKVLRKSLADEKDVPAYVVFSDRSLLEMAAYKPTDIDALRSIHGVGERKLKDYGEAFLREISAP